MEADKESLAQQLATVNVDPNDSKASEVDEASTGTGKKKKISHSSSNWEFQDAMGLSGSEKRWNKYSSILVCFLL